jgi:hypothetical protein
MKTDSFGLTKITTSEAEARSGIPAPSIHYWCKMGYLEAVLSREGDRDCYEFYALDFERFLYDAHAGKHRKEPSEILLSDLVMSPGMQLRAAIEQQTVDDYATALEAGDEFPPIEAIRMCGRLIVVDGWHRYFAHLSCKLATIRVHILEGLGEAEAFYLAIVANRSHGHPRSAKDKRNVARSMLNNPAYACLSTRELQKLTGISHNLFATVRREMEHGPAIMLSPKRDDALTPVRIAAKIKGQLRFLATTHPQIASRIADTLKEVETEKAA